MKIKTYDMTRWYNTGAKVRITLRNSNGKYICIWISKGGDTLKLDDDHSVYRIYVSYYDTLENNFISQSNNFTNLGALSGKSLTQKTVASLSQSFEKKPANKKSRLN